MKRTICILTGMFAVWIILVFSGCGQSYELLIKDEQTAASVSQTADAIDADASVTAGSQAAGSRDSDAAGAPDDESKSAVRAGEEPPEEGLSAENAATRPATIFVYVCGAVNRPGVYELPEGSRVYQAIDAAGGLTEHAEARRLNQAQMLEDGQQITVLTQEEAAASSGIAGLTDGQRTVPEGGVSGGAGADSSATADTAGKVNLNTADQSELMTLNGIGEVRAGAIIAWREQNGGFSSIEDLKQIDGIGEKSFEKLKDQITV